MHSAGDVGADANVLHVPAMKMDAVLTKTSNDLHHREVPTIFTTLQCEGGDRGGGQARGLAGGYHQPRFLSQTRLSPNPERHTRPLPSFYTAL